MPEITPLHMAIGGSAVLGGIGGLVILAVVVFGGVLAIKKIRARKGVTGAATTLTPKAVLPGLLGAAHSPLLQEAVKAIADALHAHQHAAMNAAIGAVLPPLKPFLGVIDGVVDAGLAKAAGGDAVSQPFHPELKELFDVLTGAARAVVAKQQAGAKGG